MRVLKPVETGCVPHPEDADNPRPGWIPNLAEYFEATQSAYRRSLMAQQFPRALNFMLLVRPFRSEAPEAIPVDPRTAWCMVRAGDTVLLRKGGKSHFTSVFLVDRNADRIQFLDPWPDRFLLAGDIVETAGKDMVEVDRRVFTRSLVGLLTMDEPALQQHLFTVAPDAAADPAVRLALAHTFLDYGDDRFLGEAAEAFRDVYRQADEREDTALARLAASRLHLVLLLRHFDARAEGDASAASADTEEIESLRARYGKEHILDANRAVDHYRLGLRAGSAGALSSSVYFFDRAIAARPGYADAFLYRALARQRAQHWDHVVDDTSRALALLADDIAAVEQRIAERHPGDRLSRGFDEGELEHLEDGRALALQLRGTTLNLLRRSAEAEADGLALAELRPDSPSGHGIAGFAALLMDRPAVARDRLRRAAALETEPNSLAVINDTLRQLEQDPRLQ